MHKIREATPSDALMLHEHVTAVLSERLATISSRAEAVPLENIGARIAARAASANSALFIAEVGQTIVGTLDFEGYQHSQERHGGRLGMAVRREHRGRGVGTSLVEALISWASQHSVTRLELEVFSNNPQAIRLYERLGFRQEGSRVGAVIVAGEAVDVVQMARRLVANPRMDAQR